MKNPKIGEQIKSSLGTGEIINIKNSKFIKVKLDNGSITPWINAYFCRRLKKKKPVKKQKLTLKEAGIKIEPGAAFHCDGVSVYNEGAEAIYFIMNK